MNGQVLKQGRANICDHLLLTFLSLGVPRLMVQIVVNVKAWIAKHSLLETLPDKLGIALQPIIPRIDITGICKCFPHAFFDRVRVICEDFDEFFDTTLSDCNFAGVRIIIVEDTHAAALIKQRHEAEESFRWRRRILRDALHLE